MQTVNTDEDELSTSEIIGLVQDGGAFDWLVDEPDLYSADDGEDLGDGRAPEE
jgi:hypothetical protein